MNIKSPTSLFKKQAPIPMLFTLMLLLQNCGTSENDISESLKNYEQSQADKLQFAFEATIDHIGYMSCDGTPELQQSPYFTFKVGAYNNGEGLKFKDNFISSVGKLYENKEKLLSYLAQSKRNQGAGAVMSIRESGQFRGPLTLEEGRIEDFVAPILWNLGANQQLANPSFSSLLYDNPQGVNYLSGFNGVFQKSFETSLYFPNSSFVRPALEGISYLALTFAVNDLAENNGSKARSPYDEKGLNPAVDSSVFGKGYKMKFAQFDSRRISSPRAVLTEVTGYDLENESGLNEKWVCPPNERYIIIRNTTDATRRFDDSLALKNNGTSNNPWNLDYDDGGKGVGGYYMERIYQDSDDKDNDGNRTELIKFRNKVLCPTIPDEMLSGHTEHTDPAWKRIRNLLSPDEWYVYRGERYNCIVPKKNNGSCYGRLEQPSSENTFLQYFANEDFIDQKLADERNFQSNTSIPKPIRPSIIDCEASTPPASARLCPHILSVCYKQ